MSLLGAAAAAQPVAATAARHASNRRTADQRVNSAPEPTSTQPSLPRRHHTSDACQSLRKAFSAATGSYAETKFFLSAVAAALPASNASQLLLPFRAR